MNKSQDPYDPTDTLNFIGGTLLISGPFMGILLFYAAYRHKAEDQTEKAMKYTWIGFFVFFLLSTLNAAVEANWMASALLCMLVLGYNYSSDNIRLKKTFYIVALISSALLLFFRLNFAFDLVPAIGSRAIPEFYGWKKWAKEIQTTTKNSPVVFSNSYQKAAKYNFYSQQPSLSLNNISYRRNQYDLWPIEDSLQGKKVYYILNWQVEREGILSLPTTRESYQYLPIHNFRSYTKVAVITEKNRYYFPPDTLINVPVKLQNNYLEPVHFGLNKEFPDSLVYCLFKEEKYNHEKSIHGLGGKVLDKTWDISVPLSIPKEEGTYYLRIAIKSGWLPPTINSRLIRIDVKKPL